MIKYKFCRKYIHLLSVTENVKIMCEIFDISNYERTMSIFNPKNISYLEWLTGNKKNVNDRNKTDDII